MTAPSSTQAGAAGGAHDSTRSSSDCSAHKSAHFSDAIRTLFRSRHALPLIMQSEVNECGLACLAMLASYHGKLIDVVTLRSRFRLAATGASVQHLLQAAAGLELQGRALKLELSELPALNLPVVLHWDLDHFVVLKQVRRRRFTIHDPAVGVRHYRYEELSLHFCRHCRGVLTITGIHAGKAGE